MLPESNACDAAVTVWGNRSLFTHTIRSPRCTRNCAGLYCMFSMTTVCEVPFAACCSSAALRPDARISAASQSRRPRRSSLGTALAQLRLQLLRHVEMCHERRSHLDQQRFQLGILCARDQGLVERAQHGFMVGDFVVDVGLVEGRAAQGFQFGEVLITALLEVGAGRTGLRGDMQLLHELGG